MRDHTEGCPAYCIVLYRTNSEQSLMCELKRRVKGLDLIRPTSHIYQCGECSGRFSTEKEARMHVLQKHIKVVVRSVNRNDKLNDENISKNSTSLSKGTSAAFLPGGTAHVAKRQFSKDDIPHSKLSRKPLQPPNRNVVGGDDNITI